MKIISKYFAMVAFGAATLLMGSCHGQSDEEIPEPTDPKTEVPEGTLRIFADKREIAADGNDLVTFTVMFGQEDVSEAKTLQLIRTYEGKDTYMPYGVNTFSSVVAATYTFRAEYYFAGKYETDNFVAVTVNPASAGGQTESYAQNILGFQYTSTGCVNCPTLSTNLKAIQAAQPGKLSVVSLHQNFNNIDEMTHPMTAAYYKQIKRQGLPQFNANQIINDDYITVSGYGEILDILSLVEQEYPATCGVAIQSSEIVGGTPNKVKVKVGVTSNTPAVHRFQIFFVEDKVMDVQEGHSGMYEHNNVLRATSSDNVYGDALNEGVPVQVGVEVSAERSVTIPEGCNVENMRIIVAALVSYDGGSTYVVNNSAECKLGQSVDYELN